MSLYTVYILLDHRKTCIYLYNIFIYNTHSLYIIYTARARESTQGSSWGLTHEKVNLWTCRHIICHIGNSMVPSPTHAISFATKEKLCIRASLKQKHDTVVASSYLLF